MTALEKFLAKLSEYSTNNITALEGHIQVTHNEREDLKLHFAPLTEAEKVTARAAATAKGLNTSGW